MMKSLKRTTIILLLVLLVVPAGISSAPRPAEAIFGIPGTPDIVIDPINLIQNTTTAVTSLKQLGGPLFWALAKATIQSIVASTVNWINNGFNGSPGYVTNIEATLRSVADAQAGIFIDQLTSASAIRSPFQDQVAQYVRNNYYRSTARDAYLQQGAYTLNLYTPDDTAFLAGATTKGGLNAWFAALMNPGNTPVGAIQLAQSELTGEVTGAKNDRMTELNWGQGIMSFRGKCSGASATGSGNGSSAGSVSLSGSEPCFGKSIQTPGSVIMASLNKALGSGIDTLVSARDFDEIVSALLSQVVLHISGGAGSLRDLSGSSDSSGGTTGNYFDQPDPSQATINNAVTSNFTTAITTQTTQLQQFQANWNTIASAAQNAKTVLTNANCSQNATIIANTVQPVLDQANAQLTRTGTALTKLGTIQTELSSASGTTGGLTQINQASTDYTSFLASDSVPSATEMTYALTQSMDTGTSTPMSLFTQMTKVAQSPLTCQTTTNI